MDPVQLGLNKYGKLIVQTTSSMTRLLEILYDVTLSVKLIHQQEMTACPDYIKKHLRFKSRLPISREICLVDNQNHPLAYATTLFYEDEVGSDLIQDLYSTDIPIGKLIEKYKLEIYREILDYGIIHDSTISGFLGENHNDYLIFKVSVMCHQGKNMFLICEYFPIEKLKLAETGSQNSRRDDQKEPVK